MISWAQRWRRQAMAWADNGLELLFPPRCRWCRAEQDLAPGGLCAACVRDFADAGRRCPRCGVAGQASTDAGCPACRRGHPAWDGIVVLGAYADELREAILRVKRPGHEDLARSLAMLLVDRHRAVLHSMHVDAVVPVLLQRSALDEGVVAAVIEESAEASTAASAASKSSAPEVSHDRRSSRGTFVKGSGGMQARF
jgi:hypothetical protein